MVPGSRVENRGSTFPQGHRSRGSSTASAALGRDATGRAQCALSGGKCPGAHTGGLEPAQSGRMAAADLPAGRPPEACHPHRPGLLIARRGIRRSWSTTREAAKDALQPLKADPLSDCGQPLGDIGVTAMIDGNIRQPGRRSKRSRPTRSFAATRGCAAPREKPLSSQATISRTSFNLGSPLFLSGHWLGHRVEIVEQPMPDDHRVAQPRERIAGLVQPAKPIIDIEETRLPRHAPSHSA